MRVHITLEDAVVEELDRRVGPRERSGFIARAVRRALDDERRWEALESVFGAIDDVGHDWDEAPDAWVRAQRASDDRRVG